jgi:hypothetical protein
LNHQPGSPDERTTAIASAVAFFVANVGASKLPDYNRIFNPQFRSPASVANVTRVDRGYTDSPDSSFTSVFDNFTGPTGFNSNGPANSSSNVFVVHGHVANMIRCSNLPRWSHGMAPVRHVLSEQLDQSGQRRRCQFVRHSRFSPVATMR